MQTITPFTFESKTLRTVMVEGEPWFVAKDVADALDYSESSALTRHLDDDEKGLSTVQTPGGSQEVIVLSESGLYHAIFVSRKETAQQFRKWVTAEVLPSIRKTGTYALDRWFSVREACVFIAPLMGAMGSAPNIPFSIRSLVMPFVNVPEVTRNAVVCGGDVYIKEAYIEQAVCFALTQSRCDMVQPRFYRDMREWLATQTPMNREQVLEYNQALSANPTTKAML